MAKRKFEVIQGKKRKNYTLAYKFIEAHATNTRWMGVIGLRIQWETEAEEAFYQFFHLDGEEFGLDDYISILAGSRERVEMTTARMMGGLGGELISLNEREAKYLVKNFAAKNRDFGEELPEPLSEYQWMLEEEIALSAEERQRLWEKICEPIVSPIQLINYYIMRAVGNDREAMAYLCCDPTIEYKPVNRPSTLLKNVIEKTDSGDAVAYIAESLIDTGNSYKMILTEIHVTEREDRWRICRAEIRSVMNITGTEAAFALSKDEYITVYHVKNFRELMRRLEREKPHAMVHPYEVGLLYTEFYPHNEHVKKSVYYLNDDMYGVYYITEGSQFLAAAYSKQGIRELERYFQGYTADGLLELEERFHLDRPLLYEFVNSDYDNFYDFLEDGQ